MILKPQPSEYNLHEQERFVLLEHYLRRLLCKLFGAGWYLRLPVMHYLRDQVELLVQGFRMN